MLDKAIIIFTKNPKLGKVKTRLGATIGDNNALAVYKYLINHTISIIQGLDAKVSVFYSERIIKDDVWNDLNPTKTTQKGNDLGERMNNAFNFVFTKGMKNCIIIGTDIYVQTKENIENAFKNLNDNDVVITPVEDGGYCLLGLKNGFPELFLSKTWSHSNVYNEAITEIDKYKLAYSVLPTLIDIDTEDDMIKCGLKLSMI